MLIYFKYWMAITLSASMVHCNITKVIAEQASVPTPAILWRATNRVRAMLPFLGEQIYAF